MSELLHHAAGAALPVAIGLLILAGTARLALAADLDDAGTRSLAARYLAPLSTWTLVAVAAYAIALAVAGAAGLGAFALALAICAAALAVRLSADEAEDLGGKTRRWAGAGIGGAASTPDGAAAPPASSPSSPRSPSPAPTASPRRGLWTEPDEDTRRTGLWSR